MKVYRGEIKNAYVKNIDFCDGVTVVTTDSVVVKKDALFYAGLTGRKISFDYNTYLATAEEAIDLLENSARDNPRINVGSCLFVNYGDLVPEEISKEEFKQLKKSYKEQRQNKRRGK